MSNIMEKISNYIKDNGPRVFSDLLCLYTDEQHHLAKLAFGIDSLFAPSTL